MKGEINIFENNIKKATTKYQMKYYILKKINVSMVVKRKILQ